jgi:hypothetical protein
VRDVAAGIGFENSIQKGERRPRQGRLIPESSIEIAVRRTFTPL